MGKWYGMLKTVLVGTYSSQSGDTIDYTTRYHSHNLSSASASKSTSSILVLHPSNHPLSALNCSSLPTHYIANVDSQKHLANPSGVSQAVPSASASAPGPLPSHTPYLLHTPKKPRSLSIQHPILLLLHSSYSTRLLPHLLSLKPLESHSRSALSLPGKLCAKSTSFPGLWGLKGKERHCAEALHDFRTYR